MKYGAGNVLTAIIWEEQINPRGQMPDVAVADPSPLPPSIAPNAPLAAWISGWPDGGPAFIAQPFENHTQFRSRITAALQAQGAGGQVIYEYSRGGFWQRNVGGTLLAGDG